MTGLLQGLTFLTPWALAALAALPVIWWLLRFTPPRPASIAFPPVRLLLELANRRVTPDKTPWWILLLRLAIAALVILGVSHPLLKPGQSLQMRAPLLLVIDDGWGAARDWPQRRDVANELIESASDASQAVAIAFTTRQSRVQDVKPLAAAEAREMLMAHEPQALPTERSALLPRLQESFATAPALHVAWLADGLGQQGAGAFATALAGLASGKASVEVFMPDLAALPLALAKPETEKGNILIKALRPSTASKPEIEALAVAGNGRELGRVKLAFPATGLEAEAALEMPVELRNSIERLSIAGEANAGATYLLDDSWRRKTVALMSGTSAEDNQPLLAPLYYVSRALEPYAELSEPAGSDQLKQLLDAGLSMLVLADIGVLPEADRDAIAPWLERGGILVRFAGPRLAASQDELLPVALREGGRELGSAMSWEAPQPLAGFSAATPFADLKPDPTVSIGRQVLAEPEADLSTKVWASLSDGTPLVTAASRGRGLIVLFHVSAAPDWSNLPLSGQFVDMLRRIVDRAPSAGAAGASAPQPARSSEAAFRPRLSLAANGELVNPLPEARPLSEAEFATAKASPETPAGLYARGDMQRSINLATTPAEIAAVTSLPPAVAMKPLAPQPRTALAPILFTGALLLFLLDCVIALAMAGAFRRRAAATAALALALALALPPPQGNAQTADEILMKSANSLRLAYVTTGDSQVDQASEQGLKGLTTVLSERTSVRAAEPVAINIEQDDIVFYPLLYWPVLPAAVEPSAATLQKMDRFMVNGGTIFFDLRDEGGEFGSGGASDALRRILSKLNIPPIEPVPADHVLTKSFYLLSSFPGRFDTGKLWVERGDSSNASNVDGVSSIIIGSNDYAAAWALDDAGQPIYAVIPPDERQREFAFRTGINIVMYALTGNYKSDQVHVPALLERLGQ